MGLGKQFAFLGEPCQDYSSGTSSWHLGESRWGNSGAPSSLAKSPPGKPPLTGPRTYPVLEGQGAREGSLGGQKERAGSLWPEEMPSASATAERQPWQLSRDCGNRTNKNVQEETERSRELESRLWEKYGPVFTVYFGNRPIVVLCGYEAVKEALIDKAEEFSGRKTNPTLQRTFQGYGLVFSEGERWKQLRRFSMTILRNFGMGKKSIEKRIQEEAQFLLEEFQKTQGKAFSPIFFLNCCVSNIICSIVFGNRFDYKDKEFLALMKMMNDSFRQMSNRWSQFYDMYANLLRYLPGPHTKIYDILEDMRLFIARRVKKNKETLDPNSPRDYIDCFLIQMEKEKDNPNSEFNQKNLEMTTHNLFFAGTETVSSTLRYGFLLLMKYPEVQAKMQEEIDSVIGQNRIPNIEDRSHMPYVDAVIHEVQRFSDLIPMNLAHAVTRDTEFRGYLIPKGTEVFPLLSTVLHDGTKIKSPEGFHPENFLDENGRLKRNDAFVPFSAGKRICLGEALARMELFLFFTTILQRFRLRPVVEPKDIDLTPQECGFATIPPLYELSVVPR